VPKTFPKGSATIPSPLFGRFPGGIGHRSVGGCLSGRLRRGAHYLGGLSLGFARFAQSIGDSLLSILGHRFPHGGWNEFTGKNRDAACDDCKCGLNLLPPRYELFFLGEDCG
jgi:hypothetical protein